MELIDVYQENLEAVQAELREAATRSGRAPDDVQLVAVSKTHPPEAIALAAELGLDLFGESRVQEAKAKIPLLPGHLHWHFIGHLQKNKIRAALPLFELLHGVDSLELAEQIDRIAGEEGLHPSVLLQVNVAGEASKFGFEPEQLREAMESLLALDRLEIQGLMTMPPLAPEAEQSRPYFVKLRELRDSLVEECGVPLPELSMGMSNDFAVAAEEGASLVRVGTRLFGKRERPRKA